MTPDKLARVTPTAEEYALFREAYAETYPVRPLMNAIDAKDAEIERLRHEKAVALAALEQRQKLYDELRADCLRLVNANAEVGNINAEQAATIERLRRIILKARRNGSVPDHPDMDADGTISCRICGSDSPTHIQADDEGPCREALPLSAFRQGAP